MNGTGFCALLVAAALLPTAANASIIRVGTGGAMSGCDTSSLQTAINTAAGRQGHDEIRLVQGYADNGQALTISGQDLTIRGGYENCADPDTSALERTYVNGTGGAAASVFTITGPGVVSLENLFIVGGDPLSGQPGGGIRYTGSATAGSVNVLTIIETNIEQNNGREGGGIHFTGTGAPAILELRTGAVIAHNGAIYRGGGVFLGGSATLDAQGDRVLFIDNHTIDDALGTADGGALFVEQPARADFAVPDFDQFAVFHGNGAAGDGGAIAVSASSAIGTPASVRVFSTLPDRPASFANNTSNDGAAIVVTGVAGGAGTSAYACLRNVNLVGNRSRDGQIVAVRRRAHASLSRNGDGLCGFPEEARRCSPGVACNLVAGNTAGRIANSQDGWLFGATSGGSVSLAFASITGNTTGLGLAYAAGGASRLLVGDSLLAGNTVGGQMLKVDDASELGVYASTIADNSPLTNYTGITAEGQASLIVADSIVDVGGRSITVAPTIAPKIESVLMNDPGTLAGPTVYTGRPTFVDADAGDYRLRAGSLGIDTVPSSEPEAVDLDGNARTVDLPGVPDVAGPRDLGPYEFGSGVFADSFEGPT